MTHYQVLTLYQVANLYQVSNLNLYPVYPLPSVNPLPSDQVSTLYQLLTLFNYGYTVLHTVGSGHLTKNGGTCGGLGAPLMTEFTSAFFHVLQKL
jgi:hypothetical protein